MAVELFDGIRFDLIDARPQIRELILNCFPLRFELLRSTSCDSMDVILFSMSSRSNSRRPSSSSN